MAINKVWKEKVLGMLFLEANRVVSEPAKIPCEFHNIPKGKNPGDCIIIYPPTVSTWYRMKPLLAAIDDADLEKIKASPGKDFDSDRLSLMMKYDDLLLEVVYLGVHNKEGDMPSWFKSVIKDSFPWEDIYIFLNAIIVRLSVGDFSNSIIALKAVSPLDEREIIALQENKKKWDLKAHSTSWY